MGVLWCADVSHVVCLKVSGNSLVRALVGGPITGFVWLRYDRVVYEARCACVVNGLSLVRCRRGIAE